MEDAPLSPAQRIKLHRKPLDEADLSSAIDHLEGADAEESLELSPAQCIQEADDTACQAQLDLINAQVKAHMEGKLIQNLAVIGESTDKRVRRIESSRAYTKGVQEFREANAVVQTPPASDRDFSSSRVFVRARPLFDHEAERGEWECVSACGTGVVVHEGCEKVKMGHGRAKVLRNHNFPEVTRIDSDEGVCSHLDYLVQYACSGGQATLFMYGMTGSGKTYSTNLLHGSAPQHLTQAGGVELIAYELVGKKCFDLLAPDKREVYLRVGEDGATHIQGSTVCHADSAAMLESLLGQSAAARETAATGTNATSSRSHAVYQMAVASGGTLTIIDLAGNEGNIETFNHTRDQMKEAAEINKSLMVLKACIEARAAGKVHIPYRESQLTRVLRDALTSDDACTAVLCCISPACSHLERSLVTLRTAVNLTGRSNPRSPVEQVIQEKGVVKGGPATWDSDALGTWVESQEFGDKVVLPEGMNGQRIMKLTAVRLAPICNDDREVAKLLFDALRVAAKEAAKRDREMRREFKAGPKPGSSMTFSKAAPSNPIGIKVC